MRTTRGSVRKSTLIHVSSYQCIDCVIDNFLHPLTKFMSALILNKSYWMVLLVVYLRVVLLIVLVFLSNVGNLLLSKQWDLDHPTNFCQCALTHTILNYESVSMYWIPIL